ncbi:MAG: hypothetical protein KGJ23_02125 [Euryarchaeota archaeon]|nr:hypothetical protein [Euryarchaeota archaeon]MDE1835393.1 hypothetical protein [Euryarchaeota archaeon]MDE1880496.1 hypothetical protein [Euryarchaeota archaeon]MDE2043689.1 hypothetical protein [Thermoplasmata archaeon]
MAKAQYAEVIAEAPVEIRLELFTNGPLTRTTVEQISGMLSRRWPVTWDAKVPSSTSRDHPARWHATIPPAASGATELLHREIRDELRSIDPAGTFKFRTRWNFPQSPNDQEIYEERWKM